MDYNLGFKIDVVGMIISLLVLLGLHQFSWVAILAFAAFAVSATFNRKASFGAVDPSLWWVVLVLVFFAAVALVVSVYNVVQA